MNCNDRKSMELAKAPWGIRGLDEVLEGGLPRGRTTILKGDAGSGKTVLGLEFLYRGALAGEPGVMVGFEESAAHLREYAASLGWDLAALEADGRLALVESQLETEMVLDGQFSLRGLLAVLAGKSRETGAKRVFIDALEVALRLFDDPRQVRAELHALNRWLHENALTVILSVRPSRRAEAQYFEDFFESMGDCVITLDTRMQANVSTRRLRVVKYRGSGFGRNEYPYIISDRGVFLSPISSVGLRHKPLGETFSTGITGLDAMLGGGCRRGSCTLIAGQPGTGKTILACTYVDAACRRDERLLYISFEESPDAIMGNMATVGIRLHQHVESGRLAFLTAFPEAAGVEEHLLSAIDAIERLAPAHVVIDGISACERIGSKQAGFDYLMRLLNYCKERGVTVLLVNQLAVGNRTEFSGNGVSSMVDTGLLLVFEEESGETNRVMQVLKTRGTAHSNLRREYRITEHGIELADVYLGPGKVLTGTARMVQEELDRVESQRLNAEIAAKELELAQLRLAARQLTARRMALAGERHSDTPQGHVSGEMRQ
ncbi:MAG: circadian clock protein KaiC [Vicinamibacterales bacterium]